MDVILAIIIFIALLYGILKLIRMPVLRGKLFGSLRPWYLLISPPEDLYEKLGSVLIRPDEFNKTHHFEFTAKYAGLHEFSFITAQCIPMPYEPSDFALLLRIRFIADNKTILGPITNSMQSPWWAYKETGFSLHTFRVPEDAPLDKKIQCEIQIESLTYGYCKRGEEIKVRIRKDSEK